MKVLDAKFVQGFIRMCNDGWEQGWHERNGGNLSYRMKPEKFLYEKERWKNTSFLFSPGEYNRDLAK